VAEICVTSCNRAAGSCGGFVAVRTEGLQMPARQEEDRVLVMRPLPSLQSACLEEAHDAADQLSDYLSPTLSPALDSEYDESECH
jgi:hypothetical protein